MIGESTLTLNGIRQAADLANETQAGQTGRKVLFPGKRPGLVYLTPWTKARLIALSQNAKVSQADFLEVLIRRYGLAAGSDILTALGDEDGINASTVGNADPVSSGRS